MRTVELIKQLKGVTKEGALKFDIPAGAVSSFLRENGRHVSKIVK